MDTLFLNVKIHVCKYSRLSCYFWASSLLETSGVYTTFDWSDVKHEHFYTLLTVTTTKLQSETIFVIIKKPLRVCLLCVGPVFLILMIWTLLIQQQMWTFPHKFVLLWFYRRASSPMLATAYRYKTDKKHSLYRSTLTPFTCPFSSPGSHPSVVCAYITVMFP